MRILIPLLAACLLTGCTHIGALATTSDGNGVWIATNSTYVGLLKADSLQYCTKVLDGKDLECTRFDKYKITKQPQ